jgi:hypothetical protein
VNGLLSGWRGKRVMRPAHTGLAIVGSEGNGVSEVLIYRHASLLCLCLCVFRLVAGTRRGSRKRQARSTRCRCRTLSPESLNRLPQSDCFRRPAPLSKTKQAKRNERILADERTGVVACSVTVVL